MPTSAITRTERNLAQSHLDRITTGRPPVREEWSDLPVLRLVGDVPCLTAPAAIDPLRDRSGRHTIPARARAELRRLQRAGTEFPELAVLHQLEPTGPVNGALGLLREGPLPCSAQVAREVVGELPEHPGLLRVTTALDHLVTRGTRSAGRAVRGGVNLLDPIIFGIVAESGGRPEPGEPALWYPLVAWRW